MDLNKGPNVRIKFTNESSASDPQMQPVLIVGQLANLNKINYSQVKHKIEPRVTDEVWKIGLSSLHPSLADSVSLYLGLVVVSTLPAKCSRHNAPANPHALTGVIKSACCATSETIIVVCKWDEVFASALAIARAYPLYSRKSAASSSDRQEMIVTVEFIIVDDESKELPIETLETLVEAVRLTARIVDTPCSEMNVNHFLDEIKTVSDKYNLSLKVIKGEELRDQGFHGLWSVGKASEVGPALAVVSYKSEERSDNKPVIAWVGKGIVYDTGGLSIKGKAAMPGMKRDCGGAAAVLGAMAVAGKLGFTTDLHAVFCLAENSVGPKSTRPDDIFQLYSGRSVEINNTDAEGRLVLADGVAYANKDLKADIIFDMATLTGAQGIATGKYHGAVLTNSESWEIDCMAAGKTSGDLTFPIPFSPELHFSEYSSALADMKNSVQDRCNAQSSCAGLFILAHIGFDFSGSWIHVDMATPVHSGERATGYGVGLITVLFGKYSKDPMVQRLAPKSQRN